MCLALTGNRTHIQVSMRGRHSWHHPSPINEQLLKTEEKHVTEKLSYTINEAAALAGIGRTKLYELINAGELPLVKIGARSLIRRADLEVLLVRNLSRVAA